MEWLFGSLKKPPKPEVYISNVIDGFNVVSPVGGARAPYPLYPTLPGPAYSSTQFPQSSTTYPLQCNSQQEQPHMPHHSSTDLQKPLVSPLDSIPFKISSALDSNAMPVNEYQLKSIKEQLDSVSNRVNSNSYIYTFELEKSVLNELNSR